MATQPVNWNRPLSEQNVRRRLCAFGFRFHGEGVLGREPRSVLLVFIDPQGRLRTLVHPDIRNMFRGDDLEYIDALVWDLVERGKAEPEGVMTHLCSVGGIGPLVPIQTGDAYGDASVLARLSAELVEI